VSVILQLERLWKPSYKL